MKTQSMSEGKEKELEFYNEFFPFLQNNVKTTLIWIVGFSTNFIVANFLYLLLLLYGTNKAKGKELWVRWSVESAFNILKDLYYIWVGIAFLNYLVLSGKQKPE